MGLWGQWEKLQASDKPKFFIMGTSDDFTGSSKFLVCRSNDNISFRLEYVLFGKDRMKSVKSAAHELVEDLDHWWFEKEDIASQAILQWAQKL